MKKHFVVLLPIALLMVHPGGNRKGRDLLKMTDGSSRWTGTISYNEKYSGITGFSERNVTVSFMNVLPTLHRDDPTSYLDFTDDKGTGNVTFHGEEIIEGKKISITDCQGSGSSELHEVVIDENENTYSIHAMGPACSGTYTTLLDGQTTPYGPEITDINISDQRLGANRNQLAGSLSQTFETPAGSGKVTRTYSWNLSRSTGDVELIVTPENYDNWLPEPGRDELSKGTIIKISLKLLGRSGQPPAQKAKYFELRLSETSEEPGITLNAPQLSVVALPDLRFLPQANTDIRDNFQFSRINGSNGISADISIAAYDGGAYTTLTAEAVLEDNSRVQGHLLISGGITEIPVPKRPPNSMIGTAWLIENNNPGDTDDMETSPGNNHNGDGLTAYEEYRGVFSEGRFLRLDPRKKELGVKLKRNEATLFTDGMAKFEDASGLKIIRFFENEIGADRKLNKNVGSAHTYDQYALFLQKGVLTGDLGKSFGGPAPPKHISKVVIDQSRIAQAYRDRVAEARDFQSVLTYSEKDLFVTVTAHELAHCVNVVHHGSLAPNSMNLTITRDRTAVRIFDIRNAEILARPYPITGRAGELGNEQSGDVSCFMLNNALCDWSVRITPDSMFFYQVPLIPLGTKLCHSRDGTGLNTKDASGKNNYFGDATNGMCIGQVNLKE